MKCFYHSADLDGACSGAIVKMHSPECELIGINYGDAFPWETIQPGDEVFMVDFSLSDFNDMLRLRELCGHLNLVWIDHHKSAIEARDASGIGFTGFQVIGKAGCELTWEFMSNDPPPQAVYLLGRYDVWAHHDIPGALEFQYGMRNVGDTRPGNQALW
jgi:oligoribonuclease NrnB/cAMP/cGMP phosphodiesterase (DHH superfamily)